MGKLQLGGIRDAGKDAFQPAVRHGGALGANRPV